MDCGGCCSVTQCSTLCNSMDCGKPALPVLHSLLECAQTHVHSLSDATQPSHPLSPPYPFALNLSQHQGLFQWVCSSHQVAKVLELSFSISRKQTLKKSGYMFTNNWFTMLYSRTYKTLWINYTPIKIFKQIIQLKRSLQFHRKMKVSGFHILKWKC